MMLVNLVQLINTEFNKRYGQVFTSDICEVARADATDAHAQKIPFHPRECLHAREPQGCGIFSRPTEETWVTARGGRRRNSDTTKLYKTRTRGCDEPGNHTTATSGSIVQDPPHNVYVIGDDGVGSDTHG